MLAKPLADASDKERQLVRDARCRGKTPLHKAEHWFTEGGDLIAELRPARGGVLTVDRSTISNMQGT